MTIIQIINDIPIIYEWNEIKKKFFSDEIKSIYITMYGGNFPNDKLIMVNKNKLKYSIFNESFSYTYAYPGPATNTYYFDEFGKTWGFSESDFKNV